MRDRPIDYVCGHSELTRKLLEASSKDRLEKAGAESWSNKRLEEIPVELRSGSTT